MAELKIRDLIISSNSMVSAVEVQTSPTSTCSQQMKYLRTSLVAETHSLISSMMMKMIYLEVVLASEEWVAWEAWVEWE